MIDDHLTCIRCGRLLDIDSDEFAYGEATPDGSYICERCLTGEEEGAIAVLFPELKGLPLGTKINSGTKIKTSPALQRMADF